MHISDTEPSSVILSQKNKFPLGKYKCGMLRGDAYTSGHLVPSHLGLAYVLLAETNPLSRTYRIFSDYSLRTSHGTFSILLPLRRAYYPHDTYIVTPQETPPNTRNALETISNVP